MKTQAELSREGGAWLGAARTWVQCNTRNGDRVIWGSNQALVPPLTIAQVEDIAVIAVHAAQREIYAAAIADAIKVVQEESVGHEYAGRWTCDEIVRKLEGLVSK